MVDIHSSPGCRVVETVGPYDDVRVAVAVDVARCGYGVAESRAVLVAFVRPRRAREQARGRAVEDKRTTSVDESVVVVGSSKDHIGEAITIDVTRCRHSAEVTSPRARRYVVLSGPACADRRTGGRAE